MHRDVSQFKNANALIPGNASEERIKQEEKPTSEDWREKILLNAKPQSVQEEITTSTEQIITSTEKITTSTEEITTSTEEIITSTAETSSTDKPEALTRPRRDGRRPDYLKDSVT